MIPRIAYSRLRSRSLTAVAALTVAVLGGVMLSAGSAGAATEPSAGAAAPAPSPSASSTSVTTSAAPSPSTAPDPTATTDPTASPSPEPPTTSTPQIVALDGIAGQGLMPGCVLFRTFNRQQFELLVANTLTESGWQPVLKIPYGVPVRVFATAVSDVGSYCMDASLVEVLGVTPLSYS